MKKRIISGILSAVMVINVITILPANAFAIGTESKIYEKDGYTVTYQIGSEWDGNRSVEVSIKNTGEESILNWALKYDVGGEVYNLWNSKVYDSSEEYTVIKNNGYNYEIEPGQSANYGYIVKGEETVIPEDIELCSRRIEVKSGYEIKFTVADDWHTGFNGEISITNTSDEPIEAWTLSFDSNFDINNIWNAKLLTSEKRSYKAANQLWTTPIKAGESASFGFSADKSATENANAENFVLTAVVVGESTLEYPNFDDIDYELDSDSDGLPDYYEDILGTDKNNPDTDGDGLTDGYEVFYLGTDPLKADSDDNGVNDGDEDPDNDGLSNLKEYELGTDPNNADTDGDGLTDGEEVNTYGTDPLKYDTDEDGISDGDEIALELNPNSGSTNGTPDSERTFKQVVTSDSEVLSAINEDEETPFKVSLEMKAAGVAKNNVYARESGYSNAIENSAILGAAPEFVYTDGLAVEEVTVKFELNDSAVNNTLGTYAAENDGYKGIKRLNVFMFFEDVNMLLPIETQYDETNNIVSATTDRVGTYCLMDMEMFFQNLGIEPSKSADVEGSGAMSENSIDNDNYECYTVNEMDALSSNPGDEGYIGPVSTYKDNFDVYFVVDRANYTDEVLRSYCQKILETSEKIWAVSPNVNILLYAVNGNGYSHFDNYGRFKNAGALKTELDKISQNKNVLTTTLSDGTTMREVYLSKAVDSIINSYDGKRKIYGFVFFDSANNIFQTKGDSKALLYGVKYGDRKINISVCSNIPEKYKSVGNYDEMSYAVALYKMTNGIDISAGDFTNQALEHIYGEIPKENKYQYQAIIATGYKPVVLKKKLTPYDMKLAEKRYNDPDYIFSDAELADCEDTDEDGLKDFEEVMFYTKKLGKYQLISFENDEIKLPNVKTITNALNELAYVQDGLDKAREQYGECWDDFYTNYPVLPISSNPTSKDGDGDTYLDIEDKMPLKCSLYFTQLGKSSYDELVLIPSDYDFPYLNFEYSGSEKKSDGSLYIGDPGYYAENNYGGSQMWMFDNSQEYSKVVGTQYTTKKEQQISYIKSLSKEEYYNFLMEKGGCGIIATTDYILYKLINLNLDLPVEITSNHNIEYESYIQFVKLIAEKYLYFFRRQEIYTFLWGEKSLNRVNGTIDTQRINAIKQYFSSIDPDCDFSCIKLKKSNAEKMHEKIRKVLCSNKPVMLYVETNDKEEKEKVESYSFKNNYSAFNSNPSKKYEFGSHIVNITGMIVDNQINETYYIISSWGMKLIISESELISKCSDVNSKCSVIMEKLGNEENN